MPERIEDTLLVVAAFKHEGTEYLAGDRLPIQHRWVRRLASAQPELFVMEFATEPVDQVWLAGLEPAFEERYEAALRARNGRKERQERALRAELEEQNRGQPDLERRFKKQEAERRRREEEKRAEREREAIEQNLAARGELVSGFNY